MNIKSNLINSKSLLISIICSIICIIWIRHLSALNTITYNNSDQIKFKAILPDHHYTLSPWNKLPSSAQPETNVTEVTTLSRGYVVAFKNNSTEKMYDYKQDALYDINENEPLLIKEDHATETSDNLNSTIDNEILVINTHLPDSLMYKNVHMENLKDFLNSKNSLLAEEPYLSTILSVSKDFNLNPLVMFAIAGQEQSFVPKSNKNAYKIANNPFNVFSSWQKYNTSIEDTTTIAARTIVNLSKNKPDNVDAFTWINRKYAEDQNWSKAVRSIFKQLEGNVSYLN